MSTKPTTKQLLGWLRFHRSEAKELLEAFGNDPPGRDYAESWQHDIDCADALIALVEREAEREREPSKVNSFGTLLETVDEGEMEVSRGCE